MRTYALVFIYIFISVFSALAARQQNVIAPLKKAPAAIINYIKSIGTTIIEESRAFSNLRVMFPGLISEDTAHLGVTQLKEYAGARLKQSGVPIGVGVVAAILLSSLFQHVAKTDSRLRSKKLMIAGLCMASFYGSQLRQRQRFSQRTVLSRDVINRLLLLFAASTCVTLVFNVLYDYCTSKKAFNTDYCAWSLEVAFFTMFAAATAFSLDSAPDLL